MKKIICLLFLLSAIEVKAQQSVVFKMKYLPGHTYGSLLTMAANVKISMTGSGQMVEKLKSQGITMPVGLSANLKIKGAISTGAKNADESFPLTIDYSIQDLMLELSGKKIDPLKGKSIGIKIYGHDGGDGKIKADSTFFNNKKDTSHSSNMSGALDGLQNQIKFPDRALKVGDTFTQEAPMNLPIGKGISKGVNISKTTVQSTYKLTSIADGKAYFDVVQVMDIAASVKTANVTLTGNGAGTLVYSIKDNFPLSFNDKMTLKLNVTAGTMLVDGTADITFDSTHTVN